MIVIRAFDSQHSIFEFLFIFYIVIQLRDTKEETLVSSTRSSTMTVLFLLRLVAAIAMNPCFHENTALENFDALFDDDVSLCTRMLVQLVNEQSQ